MCEAWTQNVIFRDTSQKHCMEQWNGSSGLPGICWLWKEGRWGRELPQLKKGWGVTITICVLVFVASSSRKLVGIQYSWFLKCAFLQHDLFLKLLWQGFISFCVWLSPQGRCAEAQLGSWHGSQFGKSEKKALQLPDVPSHPFPLSLLCALFVVRQEQV